MRGLCSGIRANVVLLATFCVLSSSAGPALGAAESDAAPVRVATLLPFIEDALTLAAGSRDSDESGGEERVRVVASVRRSLHHGFAEGLVDLGNPHSPSLENLAAAAPDLVIGDRGIHGRLAEPVARLGARLLLLDTSGIDATFASLLEVEQAIGGNATLATRIDSVRREVEALRVPENLSVVALFGSPGSFFVMTERAWLGDLVQTLGFELAIDAGGDEQFPGLVPVSDEVMAMARPDLVLLVAHGDPRKIEADLRRRTQAGGTWSGLASARLGIHVLDPALFSGQPGLELGRAARKLVALATPSSASAQGSDAPAPSPTMADARR